MNTEYQKEIITSNLSARVNEITEYQINIDNFKFAIEDIGDDPSMQDFKTHLQDLLSSSIREQAKAKIMLKALEAQLANLNSLN
jgi:hypothetical protein